MRVAQAARSLFLQEFLQATVLAGASPATARKWWMGELARVANAQDISLEELAVTPEQIAALQGLVDSGRINDKLARQVLEGVLAGEGDPEAIVVARGLEVVSDDGPSLRPSMRRLRRSPILPRRSAAETLGRSAPSLVRS